MIHKPKDVIGNKEWRGLKGIRPDYVDIPNKKIFELKPYNPRGIHLGIKQLQRYKTVFEKRFGGTWETFLDFYR